MLLRFKNKQITTTRLPGFESGLHLQLSRKTCHTFPFKMGMIIASTSLVIMEIEGTNSRSTLGMVSGLLQFHQLAFLFFKTAAPPVRTGWCCGHSSAWGSPQAPLTHHVSTWTQLLPITPSTFLILSLAHQAPSAQNVVVFHVCFFLLTPGSNSQHDPFRTLRKPPSPLQAGPRHGSLSRQPAPALSSPAFSMPHNPQADILHNLLNPVQSYLEQGSSFKNY